MLNFARSLWHRWRGPDRLLDIGAARGFAFADNDVWSQREGFSEPEAPPSPPSDLENFFDQNLTGPGLWKCRHYFDIYDRHMTKFRGTDLTILEIGVFSGGSLRMWRSYFGDKAKIIGVDIEPACKVYEEEGIEIVIGDQADREFWLYCIGNSLTVAASAWRSGGGVGRVFSG